MDRERSLVGIIRGVAKSQTQLTHTQAHTQIHTHGEIKCGKVLMRIESR